MRITLFKTWSAAALALLLLLSGCGRSGGEVITGSEELRYTADSEKIAVFALGEPEDFWARDDWGNGPPFNCSFRGSNAAVSDGVLTLHLTETDSGFAGAEYRTHQRTGYGFYSVSMKPAKCSGVVSSFFLYWGWPWDEIDIEFLGNDTTKVQFNYYTNGKGNHEYVYDLGFDASEDFHEYAFDWQEDSITWYVDGKPVYRVTAQIPATQGQIMVNLWNVADHKAHWAGRFDAGSLPVSAQYQWFGYQSARDDA